MAVENGVVEVDGRVEAVLDGIARGWAWHPGQSAPVELEIFVDGVSAGRTVARLKRSDLRRAGIGNGRHSFEHELPAALAGGRRVIKVVAKPSGVTLPPASGFDGTTRDGPWGGTAFVVEAAPEDQETPDVPLASQARHLTLLPVEASLHESAAGLIETIAGGVISGWAAEELGAGMPQVVATIDGEEAARARAEFVSPGNDPSRRGFRLTLPDALTDGRDHAVEISVGGRPFVVAPDCARVRSGASDRWDESAVYLRHLDSGARAAAESVVLAAGGWLFAAAELDFGAWNAPLGDRELTRLVSGFERWHEQLNALGVVHLIAAAPARTRLEGSSLPAEIAPPSDGPLRQLLHATSQHPTLEIFDLLPALRAARTRGPVSLRTSDGWSDRGAFAVAHALVKEAAKQLTALEPLSADRLALAPYASFRGPYAGARKAVLSGDTVIELPSSAAPVLAFGERTEQAVAGSLSSLRAPLRPHIGELDAQAVAFEGPPGRRSGLRAALLGEAPSEALALWLAETFSDLVVIPLDAPPMTALELDTPDVVFQVVREERIREAVGG